TVQTDSNGDGVYDLTTTDVTVLNANGSRTETVTDQNADGSLRDKMVTTTNATGLSQTIQVDSNGDGTFDRTVTDVTVLNADGSRTETVTTVSANGAIISKTVTTMNAYGVPTNTQVDVNGDGVFDRVRTDVAILNADGSLTQTV